MEKQNYSIISDIGEIERFVEQLVEGHYIVQLVIRNKYASYPVSKNYNVLRKELLPVRKIISFVKSLECPLGSYSTHKGYEINDNTGFAVYISANPINLEKGYKLLTTSLTDMLINGKTLPRHPEEYLLTNMFKCNYRHILDVEFDSDGVYTREDIKDYVKGVLGEDVSYNFVNTRGGVHTLIKIDTIPKKYRGLEELYLHPCCDIKGSQMSHVLAGTFQGGYPVTFE
ncbi:hypothetical protein NVP1170O_203 [Vibrio phage 1.170.O._10N.261.52.C3]|nr:hypothetical protein NVP1170O_203 [Vibrio phage 1.170.O._10N.261.52.C3]